jgi:hypothetical protein
MPRKSWFLPAILILLLSGVAIAAVTFTSSFYETPNATSGVISGDFNRDGRPDMAAANGSDSASIISVWLGTGAGKFGTRTDYPTPIPNANKILTADIDNDGKLDLVYDHASSNIISTLLGNGDGTFRPGPDLVAAFTVRDFDLGDFNHDGNIDAAVIECSTESASCDMQAEMNNGTGSFSPGWKIQMTGDAGHISARDMDGDGNLDLILIRTTDVLLFGGNSIGEFRSFTKFTPPAHCTDASVCADGLTSVVVGDFNNDARLDFAVEQGHFCGSACGDNTVFVYKNVGPSNTAPSFSRVNQFEMGPSAGGLLVAADLNGDQNIDLINSDGAHFGGANVYVPGNGNMTFGSQQFLPGSDISDFHVRDLNLDSRHDIYQGTYLGSGVEVDLNSNAFTNCAPPNSANLAAKICGPANGTSVASPVLVKASGNSPVGVQRLEIWVDGHKAYQKWNDQVAKKLTLAAGSHRITVVAVDMYKGTAKTSVTVNVQ